MAAVQRMRKKAQDKGTLQSNQQQIRLGGTRRVGSKHGPSDGRVGQVFMGERSLGIN
jgi:hypothetical protein